MSKPDETNSSLLFPEHNIDSNQTSLRPAKPPSSISLFYNIITKEDDVVASMLTDGINKNNSNKDSGDNHDNGDSNSNEEPNIQGLKIGSINNEKSILDGNKEIENSGERTESLYHPNKKSLWNRYFSNLEEGSLRSSIFNLVAFALGVGSQTIPLQLKNMSFLMGVIMINCVACLSYWTLNLIFDCSSKYFIFR